MASKANREPITLPPRIHFKEFVRLSTELTPVQSAGFAVFTGGKEWMRLAEWEELFEKYSKK